MSVYSNTVERVYELERRLNEVENIIGFQGWVCIKEQGRLWVGLDEVQKFAESVRTAVRGEDK